MKHLTTALALVGAAALSGCSSVVVGTSPDASLDGVPLVDVSVTDAVDAGAPRCASGLTQCNASCVDTAISPFHCGGCGRRCDASAECTDGRCVERCDAPLTRCATACTNLALDSLNCGRCGGACADGSVCRGGVCRRALAVHYVATRDTQIDASWVDACSVAGHRTELIGSDDSSTVVPLAFAFPFWGNTLDATSPVTVCTNGWIALDIMASSSLGGMIPAPQAPNSVIAARWTDLVTGPSGVCVATVGAAPSRRMAFEWRDVTYFGDRARSLTFEIVLDEGGVIELLYRSIEPTRTGEVGVEDPSGYEGLSLCRADDTSCPRANDTRIRLVPTR